CFFLCCATPTPLPRCPCAPPYPSSRLSPPSVLPLLVKACPSAASLSLFRRRVSDKSPSFLSHSSVNRRAPASGYICRARQRVSVLPRSGTQTP
ncbi:unnamed protein product, partial [Pylaiella littoralis]